MRSVLSVLLMFAACQLTGAQRATSLDSSVSDVVGRMKSDNLSVREAAFSDMSTLLSEDQSRTPKAAAGLTGFLVRHPEYAESLKVGLIGLLGSENDLFVKGKNISGVSLTEEDGEYYAEVIDTVSSLEDERAIPALVGAMTTGGMAQSALVRYGNKALPTVLDQLKSSDPLIRSVALSTSIHILRKVNDPGSAARIDDIVRSSLKDPDLVVRGSAVQEIECLDSRKDYVPMLEQLAKSDPAKLPGKAVDGGDGGEFYPVRYDARRILRDIQSNQHCAP